MSPKIPQNVSQQWGNAAQRFFGDFMNLNHHDNTH